MTKGIKQEVVQMMLDGSAAQRRYISSLDPLYFAIYYFPEYFDYALDEYHFDFFDDCKRLVGGELDEALWKAFRESAKTSIAKIAYICWVICCGHKKFVSVDSYDKANSEAILFDVTVSLQTNQKIIADFGQLFYARKGIPKGEEYDEGSKIKRLGSFITENGIKVEAHSTQEPTRGRLFKNQRPDCYLIDDFENMKTAASPATTENVIAHLKELKAGIAPNACILYLGNLIIEDGSVAWVERELKRNPTRTVVRDVPVIDDRGRIAWNDKYVHTDEEAMLLNAKITNPRKRKVSLEAKRRQLGDREFEREMRNNPGSASDAYFDQDKIKDALSKTRAPIKVSGGLRIWKEHDPTKSYAVGGDTSEGVGLDSNASAVCAFGSVKSAVVACFDDANMAPDIFGVEMARQGNLYGGCLVGPELNNTGWATVASLVATYDNVYYEAEEPTQDGIQSNRKRRQYGVRTTGARKAFIFAKFRTAFEADELEIWDEKLLREMLRFRKADLGDARSDATSNTTRHFDLLMAAAVAYSLREDAIADRPIGKARASFKSPQKPYTGLIA